VLRLSNSRYRYARPFFRRFVVFVRYRHSLSVPPLNRHDFQTRWPNPLSRCPIRISRDIIVVVVVAVVHRETDSARTKYFTDSGTVSSFSSIATGRDGLSTAWSTTFAFIVRECRRTANDRQQVHTAFLSGNPGAVTSCGSRSCKRLRTSRGIVSIITTFTLVPTMITRLIIVFKQPENAPIDTCRVSLVRIVIDDYYY